MQSDEVKERVHLQASTDLELTNDHRITLKQALVPPQKIKVIERTVRDRKIRDLEIGVWLVAQEGTSGGYKIVMREDGAQFGLASNGFPSDPLMVLTGWYGNLVSAFLAI